MDTVLSTLQIFSHSVFIVTLGDRFSFFPSPFIEGKNGGTERLSHSFKVAQLLSDGVMAWTHVSGSESVLLAAQLGFVTLC